MRLFIRLGFTAFGGPAAHIAMMEAEVVSRKKWMDRQTFLDLMGATNLIPGPNSTEMVMHVGLHKAGIWGMIVAGLSFILPAAGLTLLLAVFYVQYGSLPQVEPFLVGIQPAVLVIILGAIIKLGKKALKKPAFYLIGMGVMLAGLLGVNEVIAILCGGIIGMLGLRLADRLYSPPFMILPLLSITQAGEGKIWPIFLSFLKIGAILFGSGYVLVAYLEGELVEKLGWLSQTQLLDAIAAGQFTPGPVLTTATFVGYQLAGYAGAAVATVGIFLPSFCFVVLLNPFIPQTTHFRMVGGFPGCRQCERSGHYGRSFTKDGLSKPLCTFQLESPADFTGGCRLAFRTAKTGVSVGSSPWHADGIWPVSFGITHSTRWFS